MDKYRLEDITEQTNIKSDLLVFKRTRMSNYVTAVIAMRTPEIIINSANPSTWRGGYCVRAQG